MAQRDAAAATLQREAGLLQASAWLVALPLIQFVYFSLRVLVWLSAAMEGLASLFGGRG